MENKKIKIKAKDDTEKEIEDDLEFVPASEIEGCICEEVKEEDIEEVIKISEKLVAKCAISGGAGLAAPQIGIFKKIFVWLFTENLFQIAINPKYFIDGKKRMNTVEGCLSYPDQKYFINGRGKYVCVVYYTFNKKTEKLIKVTKKLSRESSIIFQHENDHINGITIAMRGKLIKEKKEQVIEKKEVNE